MDEETEAPVDELEAIGADAEEDEWVIARRGEIVSDSCYC